MAPRRAALPRSNASCMTLRRWSRRCWRPSAESSPRRERHIEGREFLIEGAEEIAELAPAGLAEQGRRKITLRIDLDAVSRHLRGLGNGLPERQTGGFDDDADAKRFHGWGFTSSRVP